MRTKERQKHTDRDETINTSTVADMYTNIQQTQSPRLLYVVIIIQSAFHSLFISYLILYSLSIFVLRHLHLSLLALALALSFFFFFSFSVPLILYVYRSIFQWMMLMTIMHSVLFTCSRQHGLSHMCVLEYHSHSVSILC